MRNFISPIFDDLWHDEQINENPVKRARLPKVRCGNGHRAVMTEVELVAYLEWQHPDEARELAVSQRRTTAVVSWCFGGLQTGELHAMRWEDFTEDFISGKQAKVGVSPRGVDAARGPRGRARARCRSFRALSKTGAVWLFPARPPPAAPKNVNEISAPGGNRTHDLWLRRPTLYPTELPARASRTLVPTVDLRKSSLPP